MMSSCEMSSSASYRSPAALLDGFVGLDKSDRVLEVSAGFGYWARLAVERVDNEVTSQNILEWRNFLLHVGFLDNCSELLEDSTFSTYWSSMNDPADGAEAEYDLIIHYATYHDFYDMQEAERSSFLQSIRKALKPETGRYLLVDVCGPDTSQQLDSTMQGFRKPGGVKKEFQEAGFEVIKQTSRLEFIMDDLKRSAWANPNGESDRCAYLLKPR